MRFAARLLGPLKRLVDAVWTSRPVLLLRDPPDLVERDMAVEFIIVVYANYQGRITATKVSGASAEEIKKVVEVGIGTLLTWAKQHGVALTIPGQQPQPVKPSMQNPFPVRR